MIGQKLLVDAVIKIVKKTFKFDKVLLTISDCERPLSVTSRGFLIFKDLQADPRSLILFSPTHIVVG